MIYLTNEEVQFYGYHIRYFRDQFYIKIEKQKSAMTVRNQIFLCMHWHWLLMGLIQNRNRMLLDIIKNVTSDVIKK